MFGKNRKHLQTVAFTCSTVLEGKLYFAAGLLSAAFTAVSVLLGMPAGAAGVLLLAVVSLCLIGTGVYFWKFCYESHRYKVTLGGRDNRLFLGNKLLYVLFSTAVWLVSVSVVLTAVTFLGVLLVGGTGGFWRAFADDMKTVFALPVPLSTLFYVVTDYFKFHQYYRSPEYRAGAGLPAGGDA